jgi:hypothetical protein
MSLIKLFLGGNNLVFSRPERVWSVTYRLGTGKWLTLFYSVQYKEYHSVCPLFRIGTLPTPLSPASVPLSQNRGWGHTRLPEGEGLGESQFRRLQKSLALCLLCAATHSSARLSVPLPLFVLICSGGGITIGSVPNLLERRQN